MQGTITDILEENVVQPLLVSTSAIKLAAETVRSIMKVDDIVRYTFCRNACVIIRFSLFLFRSTLGERKLRIQLQQLLL